MKVIKRDGTTVDFDRSKIIRAIQKANEAVDPEDVEMLQDLVVAAVNEALRKAEEDMNSSMGKLTGGMNLGGLGGLL